MMSFFGRKSRQEEDPLFLKDQEIMLGMITSASKEYSKTSGSSYIKLLVDCGGLDQATVVMNKIFYTSWVRSKELGHELEDEKANIALLEGEWVELLCEHSVFLDGTRYTGFRFRKMGVF